MHMCNSEFFTFYLCKPYSLDLRDAWKRAFKGSYGFFWEYNLTFLEIVFLVLTVQSL